MTSRIFVFCPDINTPSGGVRKLYRHVDVLRRHGFDAMIVHLEDGFRCTGFPHAAAVTWSDRVAPQPADVLVIPEMFGPVTVRYAPGVPRVIFNQNCYETFFKYTLETFSALPYVHPDTIATLTVSEDNQEYLRFAFPTAEVFRIRHGIDTNIFVETDQKQPWIAYMPRKNLHDVKQILGILVARNVLSEPALVPIDDLTEDGVAERLGKCGIFLSFGYPEGFGLPPAEAMACGCAVIGFHGNGGREFFRPEFSWPIAVGDILGYVKTVESVFAQLKDNPESIRQKTRAAAKFIRDNYSLEQEESDIVNFWQMIFQEPRFLRRFQTN